MPSLVHPLNLPVGMGAVKLSVILFYSFVVFAESQVFWKEASNYNKMVENRSILVSAKTGETKKLKTMSVVGAGIVTAPLAFAYKTVRQFDQLPKVSDRFHEAIYDSKKNSLFLHMSAMGYHVKMRMKLKFDEQEKSKDILWEVIEGGFLGMKGKIHLAEYNPRRTEMSLDAYYENEKLPLPKVLMGFGLEVVTQRAAGLMRSYIEDEYKK